MTLVLASQSLIRLHLLREAGIAVKAEPAHIDEEAVTAGLMNEHATPRQIADSLAELKAQRISMRVGFEGNLVLGCDQVLDCNAKIFSKPASEAEALEQLRSLRGKTHNLTSAAVLSRAGSTIWRHVSTAQLTMREYSEDFLSSYAARTGPSLTHSAGGYALEGLGAQLFTDIKGDYFTILGLPLLPVLDALRTQGELLA